MEHNWIIYVLAYFAIGGLFGGIFDDGFMRDEAIAVVFLWPIVLLILMGMAFLYIPFKIGNFIRDLIF